MKIDFNSEKHQYKIDGTVVPSVTQALEVIPKGWMGNWVAKEIVEKLHSLWQPNKGYSVPEIEDMIKEAKNAWRRKRDTAATAGTNIHSLIEAYIKARIEHKHHDIVVQDDPAIQNSIEKFLKWEATNGVHWIHSELVVGNESYRYAGKLDAVAYVAGIGNCLIDLKTGASIYDDMAYQLAGYQYAYEGMGVKPDIAERMIVWIPRKGEGFEAKVMTSSFLKDFETFSYALQLWRVLHEHKSEGK